MMVLFIASLFPDMVDKTVGYVFHAMPNGRHYAHNIFSLTGTTLLITLLWGRPTGYAWFMGYLGHLLADLSGLVPWLFPLKRYPFKQGRLSFNPSQLLKETIFLALVFILHRAAQNTFE